MSTETVEKPTEAEKYETVCRAYAHSSTLTYALAREDGKFLYRGPCFATVTELLESEDAGKMNQRVNKRTIRSFSVRKYEGLSLYDRSEGEVIALIDDETHALVRS